MTVNPIIIAHQIQTKSISDTISPWQDPMCAQYLSNTTPLEYSLYFNKLKTSKVLL